MTKQAQAVDDRFPTLVYKGKGPHSRAGGTYAYAGVDNQTDLDSKLAEGWFATLPEAIATQDNPPVEIAPTPSTTATTELTAAKVAPAKGTAKVAPAQPWVKG